MKRQRIVGSFLVAYATLMTLLAAKFAGQALLYQGVLSGRRPWGSPPRVRPFAQIITDYPFRPWSAYDLAKIAGSLDLAGIFVCAGVLLFWSLVLSSARRPAPGPESPQEKD